MLPPRALQTNSLDAIAQLEKLGVDLSHVTLLGGHSVPRSRTNPVGNLGRPLGILDWALGSARATTLYLVF
jgi:hypothetical protein